MTFRKATLTAAAAAALLAGAALSSAASAQTAPAAATPEGTPASAPAAPAAPTGPQLVWNFGAATDYVFRGVSQTKNKTQGFVGADLTYNMFYVGTWTSNVDFSPFGDSHTTEEVDLYGGIRPTVGPLALDLGVYYYGYLNQPPAGGVGYFEFYGKGTHAFGPVTVGASFFYSPQFTGRTGHAEYYEGNAAWTISPKFSVSGAVGRQNIEAGGDYTTWNGGLTYTINPAISLDVRYWDTNINNAPEYKSRVVATLKATF